MSKKRQKIKKFPDIAGLVVDWLHVSAPENGVIRMFGLLVNEICWVYFTVDPHDPDRPASRQEVFDHIKRGNDDDMRKIMYSLLVFTEDKHAESFARSVLEMLNDAEYLDLEG